MKNKGMFGRSMLEMLGVLAIIGVLSIGSVLAFKYAMNKVRANKVVNDGSLAYGVAGTTEIEYDIWTTVITSDKSESGLEFLASRVNERLFIRARSVPTDVCKHVLRMRTDNLHLHGIQESEENVNIYDDELTDEDCSGENGYIDMVFAYDNALEVVPEGGKRENGESCEADDECNSNHCYSGRCISGEEYDCYAYTGQWCGDWCDTAGENCGQDDCPEGYVAHGGGRGDVRCCHPTEEYWNGDNCARCPEDCECDGTNTSCFDDSCPGGSGWNGNVRVCCQTGEVITEVSDRGVSICCPVRNACAYDKDYRTQDYLCDCSVGLGSGLDCTSNDDCGTYVCGENGKCIENCSRPAQCKDGYKCYDGRCISADEYNCYQEFGGTWMGDWCDPSPCGNGEVKIDNGINSFYCCPAGSLSYSDAYGCCMDANGNCLCPSGQGWDWNKWSCVSCGNGESEVDGHCCPSGSFSYSEYYECCQDVNSYCICPSGQYWNLDLETCVEGCISDSGCESNTCCNNYCCPTGEQCCGGSCCNGYCCNDRCSQSPCPVNGGCNSDEHCPTGEQCCGGSCCNGYCCNGQCSQSPCCSDGEIEIGGRCCPSGSFSYNDANGCCTDSNGDCVCPSGQVWSWDDWSCVDDANVCVNGCGSNEICRRGTCIRKCSDSDGCSGNENCVDGGCEEGE